jgi:hypothetical protein
MEVLINIIEQQVDRENPSTMDINIMRLQGLISPETVEI